MRHCSSPSHSHRRSLRKLHCPHIDKTFPDLVDRLRREDSTQTRESVFIGAMREYEKKFYKDEISLLLEKIDMMEAKNKKQEDEIGRLRNQVRQLNSEKQRLKSIQPDYQQLYEVEKTRALQQNFDLVASRLKTHYQILMDKVKSDYQMRLVSKQNQCKAVASELQVKALQLQLHQQKFKKQKQSLLAQLCALQKYKSVFVNKDDELGGLGQVQSYKEENALLRSFIYKIQMAEHKIEKLEESRLKERREFAQFAQENQDEKRQLSQDLEQVRSHYEEKFRLQQSEFQFQTLQKCQLIKQLQLQIEEQRLKNTLKSSQIRREAEQALTSSMVKQEQANKAKEVELEYSMKSSQILWSRIEASLSREKEEKERRIQQLLLQLEEYQKKEVNYLREIEKLREERNGAVVENNNLAQKINFLKDELSIAQREFQDRQVLLRSRIDQLVSKQVQSRTSPINNQQQDNKQAQLAEKLRRLESELLSQKQHNKQLQSQLETLQAFHLGQQSLLKNNCQLTEQSNLQLQAQKEKIYAQLQHIKTQKQNLEQVVFQHELQIREKESELCQTHLYHQKERELIQAECETLREKYDTYKQQCEEHIDETNNRIEQLEVTVLRLRLELESCNKQLAIMNNKLNIEVTSAQTQLVAKQEQIHQLTTQLRQIEDRHTRMESDKQRAVEDLKLREQLASKQIQMLQSSIESLNQQMKRLSQSKQKQIIELRQRVFNSKDKKRTTLFQSNENLSPKQSVQKAEYLQKIDQYRAQILQINSAHQNEIDHLKQYIFQLLEDNDRIRENYIRAAQTWREMYEGVVKYNKFVDRGQEVLEHSTLRKKEIQDELESKHKSEGQNIMSVVNEQSDEMNSQERFKAEIQQIQSEYQVEQAVVNTVMSEVCTIPDFSQRKPEANISEERDESLMQAQVNLVDNTQSRCSSLNFPFANNTKSIYILNSGECKYEYQAQENRRMNAVGEPSIDELGAYLKKSLEFESNKSKANYSFLRGQNQQ